MPSDPNRPGLRSLDGPLLGLLVAGGLVGALAAVPYQLAIAPDLPEQLGMNLTRFVTLTVANATLLAALGALIGVTLGRRVGLGAPLLSALARGQFDGAAWRPVLRVSVAVGLAAGAFVVLADLALSPLLPEVAVGTPSLAARLLASLYGGINEELLLRFGLMSAIVWVGGRLFERGRPPSDRLLWAAATLAAIAFGISHLPALATLTEPTPVLVARTIVLNAVPGVAFGWLFFSRGLAAAMIAHATADIVIQTATATLLA